MNFYQSVSANKAVNVQRFLDTYTGAVAAYSLRRLRTGHTGYAVEVRRASDNSTRDIGFDADGNFHVSALEEFCSGTDGYVAVWYDQTSNGYDVSQTDTTKQPKIYDSTTGISTPYLSGINSRAAVGIYGAVSNPSLASTSSTPDVSGGYSYYAVIDTSGYNASIFNFGTSNVGFRMHANTTGGATHIHGNNQGVNIVSTGYDNFGQRIANNAVMQSAHYDGSTTGTCFITRDDGYNVTGERTTLSALPSDVGSLIKLSTPRAAQEYIIFGEDKSSQRKEIESAINSYYTVGQLNYDLPLDTYTNVTAAYSVRKLRSAYTGYCMEVYNGTTYADIGFNEFNELDVPAIAAHCGTNDGFVSKLYDQSGNSYTASQTDSAKMPKIYDGTSQSVIFKNGKPVIEYLPDPGTGEVFASLDLDTSVSINVTTAHFFFVTGRDSGRRGMWTNGYPGPYNLYVAQSGNSGGAGVGELHVNGTFRGVLNKQQFAGAIGAQAVYNSKQTLNGTGHRIGSDQNGMHDTQEIIIFDSAMDDDREAIENNQNTYFNVY